MTIFPFRTAFFTIVIGLAAISLAPGCAVVMASRQPSKKDLSLLAPGTDRDVVIGEFGVPVTSERLPDGGRKDVYTFIQGYSTGTKFGRALFHGSADVLTLGLWEAAGTPLEATFDGKKITVRVTFNAHDRIVRTETLLITKP